jgi:hypothetical protein
MGIAGTGKPVERIGIELARAENNKIIESWVSWDLYGMLQQLGATSVVQQSGPTRSTDTASCATCGATAESLQQSLVLDTAETDVDLQLWSRGSDGNRTRVLAMGSPQVDLR